jgi:hypothetical protein
MPASTNPFEMASLFKDHVLGTGFVELLEGEIGGFEDGMRDEDVSISETEGGCGCRRRELNICWEYGLYIFVLYHGR